VHSRHNKRFGVEPHAHGRIAGKGGGRKSEITGRHFQHIENKGVSVGIPDKISKEGPSHRVDAIGQVKGCDPLVSISPSLRNNTVNETDSPCIED
jgi:hypothetical protein